MVNNREYYQSLVANNQNDDLIALLLEATNWYKMQQEDPIVSKKYDELLLLSSRNQGISQSARQGVLTPADIAAEENRINIALLSIINDLPASFYSGVAAFTPRSASSAAFVQAARPPQTLNIPSGLGKGLYWVMATFLSMISGGSLIQGNKIAFTLTAAAVLLCAPASYEWLSAKTKISLSNGLRVLLIITLMLVGLSYAAPAPKASGTLPTMVR